MDFASNAIMQFLENKTILITGGTGFLAKIFLEKMLRVQPNVRKIYLLIRAPDNKSVSDRFQNEVIAKDLFKILKEKHGRNFDSFLTRKVVPVAGDISDNNLGVNDANMREQMWRHLNVIVNFAATTDFDERYDVSLDINTFGALNVLNFSMKCQELKIFLHVSTAYVCGEKTGRIQEKSLEMGEALNEKSRFDINEERKLANEMLNHLSAYEHTEKAVTSGMKNFGIKRARQHGWPNTYVFTKAMGEMLLEKYKNEVPLIILRPTMVTSTYQQPFPGWIEGLRTIDAVLGGYGKGKIKCLPYDSYATIDLVPADIVINAMMVAIVVHANQSFFGTIYQIGTSSGNPLRLSSLEDFTFDYFTKNPLMDRSGKPIMVKKIIPFNTMTKFRRYMIIRYMLPLKVLKLINMVTFQFLKETYDNLNGKIKLAMRLANLYKPYMFFKGIFDDTNSKKLRIAAREMGIGMEVADDDGFNFDPRIIDWEDYFMNSHIPGLVNHVILKRKA